MENDFFIIGTDPLLCIIDAVYKTLDYIPREFDDVYAFTLGEINAFCSYISGKKLTKNELQVSALNILMSAEQFFAKDNAEYHEKIIDFLMQYWDKTFNKNENILSYMSRCLNISGLLKFFCTYYKNVPNKEWILKTREEILKELDKIGPVDDESGAIDVNMVIANILRCLPNGLLDLLNSVAKICINEYRLVCRELNPKRFDNRLEKIFADFNEASQ